MEVKLNKFTQSIMDLKSSLDGNSVLNNKYFNYKDAAFTGVVGAGGLTGYALGSGDKKGDMAINGAMFGVGIAAMGRYGAKRAGYEAQLGMTKSGLSAFYSFGSLFNREMKESMKDKAAFIEKINSAGNAMVNPEASNTTLKGLGVFAGITAMSALSGGIGGAASAAAGMDTSFTGGAIEGAALTSLLYGVSAISSVKAGRENIPGILKGIGVGKVAGLAGGIYGGYDEWKKKDSTLADVMLKGAVYSKVAMSIPMLGMERYGGMVSGALKRSNVAS